MATPKTTVDFFADIAATHVTTKKAKLTESLPPAISVVPAPLSRDNSAPTAVPPRMSSAAELKEALSELRGKYMPFLQDLAPALSSPVETIQLKEFILDGNEKITLPHYGGPEGIATKNYETTFCLPELAPGKAVYLCFGGVDYIATVYLNGECVGKHEGFFSPFDFEVTRYAKAGENHLRITVENDYIYMGNQNFPDRPQGDKMYAATGVGYDDPELGWHHCPPGMGIYNYVRVEIRNEVNISDLYIRPIPDKNAAEIWLEVENATATAADVSFEINIYGQNFSETVIEGYPYKPVLAFLHEDDICRVQMNDTDVTVTKDLPVSLYRNPLYAMKGKNVYKILLPMESYRLWTLETPYLYQAQVKVLLNGKLCDAKAQQFGMRTFTQDKESTPKGRLYLNGKQIKLRGGNTMGFEQQDVMAEDFDQLVDDILLAKICNMNFWRLTQRPVQDEVYAYCDRLGLLTQTDLPLFSCMRRTKLAELVRQTEEMIRLVRKHPCNVMISYINEAGPDGNYNPHRHYTREELEEAFEVLDKAALLSCPDCVFKHIDGDYDAPSKNSIQDSHTYTLWYNGNEIEFGKLHRGYWMDYDQEWCCGCGEYGAEGLDPVDLMQRRYPKEWLKEPFDPSNIVKAQAGTNHHHFYQTPDNIDDWVYESQKHQAFCAKYMTEAFRRKPEMVTSAIHLFIDAWPSGWMKSIMDCERTPKQAYFTYRDALSPVLVSLRSDRFTYYAGEKISVETYLCNDTNITSDNCSIIFELYNAKGEKCQSTTIPAWIRDCDISYIANAEFTVDSVQDREKYQLKAIALDADGNIMSTNEFCFEVFEDVTLPTNDNTVIVPLTSLGEQTVAGETVIVDSTKWYNPRHFVSKKTGHPAVKDFEKEDFKLWYDAKLDRLAPIADNTFFADGFSPILVSYNCFAGKTMEDGMSLVVGEKVIDGKRYILSTLDFRMENPVAKRFMKALLELA